MKNVALVSLDMGVTTPSPDTIRAGALVGPRLQRVLAYINDNLQRDLTVAEMASVACLSRFHFTRAFREATGQPPYKYVTAKRLERATQLLTQTHRPLADIALSICFSSQANFNRAFRSAMGMPPGVYRRRQAWKLSDNYSISTGECNDASAW